MSKSCSKPTRTGRRGWATLWLIIWLPALLALFCALIGIANLWLARVELENAMESAALAAVKQWGDANGGDTLIPRQIGQAYAAANCMRKVDVAIGTNYNPAGGPNQNDLCLPTDANIFPPNGNLIFGAIDDSDPNNVIFNAGIMPGCGAGLVVFDVTGQGDLDSDAHNEWGIAFHPTPTTPPGLRIEYVIITLPAGVGIDQFEDDFQLSDNTDGQWLVAESPVYRQPDIFGFSDPAAQITHSYPIGPPNRLQLRIDFSADGMTDAGFEPCDRFRFGQNIDWTVGGGGLPGNLRDADGVGFVGTTILVHFSDGSEATGTYADTTDAQNDCAANPSTLPCPAGAEDFSDNPVPRMVVHPQQIDDLPCPPGPPPNNGQSFGSLAPGGLKFGVRAQAIVPVSDFGCVFLGTVPQGCVQAKATAIYDCVTRRPRLIRIDRFICPGPDEADGVIVCDFCAPGP